jgi:sigma-B regulation protein RsbU (phosphoserine phosphatase)
MLDIKDSHTQNSMMEETINLLIRRQAELNSLLEITQAINQNNPESTLFQMFEFVLKMHLKVGKLRVYMHTQETWALVCSFGVGVLTPKQTYNLCQKLTHFTETTDLTQVDIKELEIYDFLIPVFFNEGQFAYVLLGEYPMPEFVSNDANFISTILHLIMVALENKRLFKERLKQERLQKEMDVAEQVQSMLFPKELPRNRLIEMDAVYLPHHSIGGDYYDYIELNPFEFLVCIADVTGKGISAALLMANFQANLRALAKQNLSLITLVKELNGILYSSTKGEKFITLFVAIYNTQTRTLHYINAGHQPPLVIYDNKVSTLNKGCTVIGVFEELPFVHSELLTLEPGTLVFCYTDGLIEFDEEDENLLDGDGLRDFLMANQKYRVHEINARLMRFLKNKSNRDYYDDDITLLSFKCK